MRKNSLYTILSALSVSLAFTSCLKNDNTEYETTSDAFISAFSIGDIETRVAGKTAAGKDTTFVYKVTGTDYPFTINQLTNEIYNNDSLPLGTNVKRVLTEITYSYYISYAKNGQDTVWASTDSLDFSNPISFKVYAMNGSTRLYNVKLNVHKQDPDSLQWGEVQTNLSLPAFAPQKAVYCNNRMYIFVQESGKTLQVTSSDNGFSWSALQPVADESLKADYSSVLALNGSMYLLADGKLYSSADGVEWAAFATDAPEFDRLFAASPRNGELYAATADNTLYAVTQEGTVRAMGAIDSDARFPNKDLSYSVQPLASNPKIERLTLVGNSISNTRAAADTAAVVWTKLSTESQWTYYPQASGNVQGLPQLEKLFSFAYDGKLFAFGGTNSYQASASIPAFQGLYSSMDGGIGWWLQTTKTTFPLTDGKVSRFAGRAPYYSCLVDADNYIWIFWNVEGTPEVWRGKVNRLGFDK